MQTIKNLVFYLCLSFCASTIQAEEIPLKAFAALPSVSNVRLSPDGQSIAYLQNVEGSTYLIIQASGNQPKSILSSDNKKYYFTNIRWVNSERLLVGARFPSRRFGVDSVETRMLAINRDGSNLQGGLLNSELDIFRSRKHVPQLQDSFISRIAGHQDSVLVALDLDEPNQPDVYRLNVETARLEKVVNNPGSIFHWIADRDGEVRAGLGWRGKTMRVIVKAPGTNKWQTLSSYTVDDYAEARQKEITPLGFDGDPRWLYVNADHQGRQAIFRVDLSKPDFPRELIHADSRFDVSGNLIYAPWLKKVVGLRYSAEYGERFYWDDSVRQLQQQIDKALPTNHNNIITSSSDDGMRHIVTSFSLSQAPRIYWLDRKTGTMVLLADTYPDLPAAQMSTTDSIKFKSRDGLELHGYLTMPKNKGDGTGQQKFPLVLFPHGGPSARDIAAFDNWTQFFANRGWAVLQVNFRGSSGYGSDFETAGFKRWGLEMQDDLTDGVEWLVKRGTVDPSRICIVGASYGGYAVMMGIVKTPDLYRCAISIAGIADLRSLLSSAQRYTNYEVGVERQIGEWWNDRERLRQTSPINRVKEIRTPLLLIHGKEDRVVPVDQSRDMADALKSAGNPSFDYIELPLGDHNLSREEDSIKTFVEMEKFLKKYLN